VLALEAAVFRLLFLRAADCKQGRQAQERGDHQLLVVLRRLVQAGGELVDAGVDALAFRR